MTRRLCIVSVVVGLRSMCDVNFSSVITSHCLLFWPLVYLSVWLGRAAYIRQLPEWAVYDWRRTWRLLAPKTDRLRNTELPIARASISVVSPCRPDVTFALEWALKTNDLSILSLSGRENNGQLTLPKNLHSRTCILIRLDWISWEMTQSCLI